MTSKLLFLEVCRTHVIHELSFKMASLSMSSHGSVDRAPGRCLGGHGFDSRQRLTVFWLNPTHVMLIISSLISYLSPSLWAKELSHVQDNVG